MGVPAPGPVARGQPLLDGAWPRVLCVCVWRVRVACACVYVQACAARADQALCLEDITYSLQN